MKLLTSRALNNPRGPVNKWTKLSEDQYRERNKDIVRQILDGDTCAKCGTRHDITLARVNQIFRKWMKHEHPDVDYRHAPLNYFRVHKDRFYPCD